MQDKTGRTIQWRSRLTSTPENTPSPVVSDLVPGAVTSNVEQLISSISAPVRSPVLPTPKPISTRRSKVIVQSTQCHSARLESKRRNNCKIELISQEILSKRFGVMNDSDTFDENIKQLYLQRYKRPLTPRSLKMIADLVEKGGTRKLKVKATKIKGATILPA